MSKKTTQNQKQLDCILENIRVAENNLVKWKRALTEFMILPENNVYQSIEDALSEVSNTLLNTADEHSDELGYCGVSCFKQYFMVGLVKYIGFLHGEYDDQVNAYAYGIIDNFTYNTL